MFDRVRERQRERENLLPEGDVKQEFRKFTPTFGTALVSGLTTMTHTLFHIPFIFYLLGSCIRAMVQMMLCYLNTFNPCFISMSFSEKLVVSKYIKLTCFLMTCIQMY